MKRTNTLLLSEVSAENQDRKQNQTQQEGMEEKVAVLKLCRKCGLRKPKTLDFFGLRTGRKGIRSQCRKCDSAYSVRKIQEKRNSGRCGCGREVFHRKTCFRCYCQERYKAMRWRCDHQKSYIGRSVSFSWPQFLSWCHENKPVYMKRPSIDRIDNNRGYDLDNIQWLEMSQNSRGINKNLPDGYKHCCRCREVLAITTEHFYRNKSGEWCAYCKPCCSMKRDPLNIRKEPVSEHSND